MLSLLIIPAAILMAFGFVIGCCCAGHEEKKAFKDLNFQVSSLTYQLKRVKNSVEKQIYHYEGVDYSFEEFFDLLDKMKSDNSALTKKLSTVSIERNEAVAKLQILKEFR